MWFTEDSRRLAHILTWSQKFAIDSLYLGQFRTGFVHGKGAIGSLKKKTKKLGDS
jgi:hypothetical protein